MMKTKLLILPFVLSTFGTIAPVQAENFSLDLETNQREIIMYRLYNSNSGEHLYTGDSNERKTLMAAGWKDEGPEWVAPSISNTPVYRLYNPNTGDHHYTTDKNESSTLVKVGWRDEGIKWYSDDGKIVPLYRVYNPNAKQAGSHHYTVDKNEVNALVSKGWKSEGIGWYGLDIPERVDLPEPNTPDGNIDQNPFSSAWLNQELTKVKNGEWEYTGAFSGDKVTKYFLTDIIFNPDGTATLKVTQTKGFDITKINLGTFTYEIGSAKEDEYSSYTFPLVFKNVSFNNQVGDLSFTANLRRKEDYPSSIQITYSILKLTLVGTNPFPTLITGLTYGGF